MSRRAAFRFIPELVQDFVYVRELSGNPTLMYIESAMNTLHMATSVFAAIEEHINTKRKEEAEQEIRKRYGHLADIRAENYRDEELQRLDIDFETVRAKVQEGLFRDEVVRDFVSLLQTRLFKVIETFSSTQMDTDFAEQSRIDELTRKALRDYRSLIAIYIEEGGNDSKKGSYEQ